MPSAPPKACHVSGCPDTSGRCATHRRNVNARGGSRFEERRKSPAARGYDRRWQDYRAAWLGKRPFCGDRLDGPSSQHSLCRAEGREVTAGVVDHVVPVNGPNDPGFYDPANHQSLCAGCHNRKTATEDGGFLRRIPGERFVVTGRPGSGKSAWVAERARPGDIVVDLGRLADAVGNVSGAPWPRDLARALVQMRDATLAWLEGNQTLVHVFVIVTDGDEAASVAQRIRGRLHRIG